MTERKRRLGAQYWGVAPAAARAAYGQVFELVAREFPDQEWYPFGKIRDVWGIVGENLISGFLTAEFAELFRGLDEAALDELTDSFRSARCVPRTPLIEHLTAVTRPIAR